jgi:polyhydroxybutyrate depolymerase
MRGVLVVLASFYFFAILGGSAEAAGHERLSPDTVTDFNKFLVPGKYRAALRLDDRERRFLIVTPPGLKTDEPLPLVFFFHGAGGNSEQASHTYGWVEKARAKNFIVVFSEGLGIDPDAPPGFATNPNVWRDERFGAQGRVNDVHFFEILLHDLQTCLPVDPRRIYVTGFSNGAAMTFTLGARFSDRIAAIAPVGSQSFARTERLARPLPVYYLVGTADPLIPFHGGAVTLPWGTTAMFPPIQESVDAWVKLDGCPVLPAIHNEGPVRTFSYGPGRDDVEILFTTIEGNGHHWPGSVEPLPASISGPALDPFSATDRIWDFFEHHPLEGRVPAASDLSVIDFR